jgi:beta-lactamase class A
VISPCYTETYTQQKQYPSTYPNKLDYLEYRRKKLRRKAYIRKQQQAALRRLIFLLILCIIFTTVIFKVTYRHVYLPVVNSKLELKLDKNFLNSSVAMFSTADLLGHQTIFDDTYKAGFKSIMRPIPLRRELKGLKRQLLPIVNSDPDYTAGIFIWDAQTHNFVSINGDRAFSTASIIKIPVLIELFRRIDYGLTKIDKEVEFQKFHQADGSGWIQYRPIGGSYSLEYLARLMIQFSDNTATNILLDEVGGLAELNDIMIQWGIQNGHMENWLPDLTGTNVMSPKDYTMMLYNVAKNPEFLSPESRDKIIEIMSNIKNRNLINCGMPCGSTIAHKTGDIGKMVGDAGIITLPDGRKIIMVAMVERPWNSYKAKEMIRNAARITYDYFY